MESTIEKEEIIEEQQEEKWWTSREAWNFLGVTKRTLTRWIADEKFPNDVVSTIYGVRGIEYRFKPSYIKDLKAVRENKTRRDIREIHGQNLSTIDKKDSHQVTLKVLDQYKDLQLKRAEDFIEVSKLKTKNAVKTTLLLFFTVILGLTGGYIYYQKMEHKKVVSQKEIEKNKIVESHKKEVSKIMKEKESLIKEKKELKESFDRAIEEVKINSRERTEDKQGHFFKIPLPGNSYESS